MRILDLSAGNRAIWFDKQCKLATFAAGAQDEEAMTSEPSDEGKGGPIEFDRDGKRWTLLSAHVSDPDAVWGVDQEDATPADLLAALRANPAALADVLEAFSYTDVTWTGLFRTMQLRADEAESQLTEARAELERVNRQREASLAIIAEEYPKLGQEWRSCLAFVLGALGAGDLHEQLISANPLSPPAAVEAKPVCNCGAMYSARAHSKGCAFTVEAKPAEGSEVERCDWVSCFGNPCVLKDGHGDCHKTAPTQEQPVSPKLGGPVDAHQWSMFVDAFASAEHLWVQGKTHEGLGRLLTAVAHLAKHSGGGNERG